MDLSEATKIVDAEIEALRRIPYSELRDLAREHATKTSRHAGRSDVQYCLEVQFFFDGSDDKDVRVLAAIDDGGLRAFHPLTRSFIKGPNDVFIGE